MIESLGIVPLPEKLGSKWNRILSKHLEKARIDITNRLLKEAREVHRYKNNTRNLRNATKADVKVDKYDNSFAISINVDEKKAPYAKYVISGHGTWQGDPFLDKALERNNTYINERINRAVYDATIEMNS